MNFKYGQNGPSISASMSEKNDMSWTNITVEGDDYYF
jgi:hypothetical protein